jgi:hypothetical protein
MKIKVLLIKILKTEAGKTKNCKKSNLPTKLQHLEAWHKEFYARLFG